MRQSPTISCPCSAELAPPPGRHRRVAFLWQSRSVTSPDNARILLARVLGTESVDQVCDTAPEGPLKEVRAALGLHVDSLQVNGDRIDATVSNNDDTWRIVLGATRPDYCDWLHVYRRPESFSAVPGGVAVVINGPSSAGKSTLLRAIRTASQLPWVCFDEPFFGDVAAEYLIWREQAQSLHHGYLDAIAALARAGNLVALSAAGFPSCEFGERFAASRVIRVGLDADLDTLRDRERVRSDVPGGLAEASIGVHEGWSYDVRYDSASQPASQIAAAVLSLALDR